MDRIETLLSSALEAVSEAKAYREDAKLCQTKLNDAKSYIEEAQITHRAGMTKIKAIASQIREEV